MKRVIPPILCIPAEGLRRAATQARDATEGPRGRRDFPTRTPLAGAGRPWKGRPAPPFPGLFHVVARGAFGAGGVTASTCVSSSIYANRKFT